QKPFKQGGLPVLEHQLEAKLGSGLAILPAMTAELGDGAGLDVPIGCLDSLELPQPLGLLNPVAQISCVHSRGLIWNPVGGARCPRPRYSALLHRRKLACRSEAQ